MTVDNIGIHDRALSSAAIRGGRMTRLARRGWVPANSERLIAVIADRVAMADNDALDAELLSLVADNQRIHLRDCVNLNPAANTMNPRAEALLSSGLGSRPSLGYPGDKYEMGLEAIEQIEVIAAELAAEVFHASFAEVRLGSGALANLYAFMATTQAGDPIIVPPAAIGGHVTHQQAGAAGLYGLDIHDAPIDPGRYTIDIEAMRATAHTVRPKLISIGGSLNLFHHPVAEIRQIADEVGAVVLFDAAHLSGPIAGGAWPNPLDQGAHVMTMSTYKSLGGPPAGLLVTTDATIAERVDAIAYPGLTANFDAANTAALAMTLLDWRAHGSAYAAEMVMAARTLATALADAELPVHAAADGATRSHAFALDAGDRGGGHATARSLRSANLLTSAIGLPHDVGAGVRLGTNEAVRWGITTGHMPELASLIARAWRADDPTSVAADVSAFRTRFQRLRYVR
jgi:glycine hydroxymethyltransferase